MLHRNVLWRIYVAGNNETYFGLHVMCPTCLSDFNKILKFLGIFPLKPLNTKFQGNPSSGNRADTSGQTDMTKLMDAFRACAKDVGRSPVCWPRSESETSRIRMTEVAANRLVFFKTLDDDYS